MKQPIALPWSQREPLLQALEALAPGEGQAEHEADDATALLRFFLPTPSFRRALDPNAMLVVGERGAGKTELFRVLGTGQGFAALEAVRPGETLKPVAGFGRVLQQQTDQPLGASVQSALQGSDEAGWRAFWVGMLAARLLRQGEPLELPETVAKALQTPAHLAGWLPELVAAHDSVVVALDRLDAQLQQHRQTVLVAYDELDRVVPHYLGLFPPLRALLALWLEGWRRWQRLRPKIILRTDLWESRLLAFPGAARINNHRVILEWQPPWLYRMAVKRMLNGPAPLADFAREGARRYGFPLQERQDPLLGVMPAMDEDAFAGMVTALVGEYMGANPRKGWSYDWPPNHLPDSQGRLLPRPFLQLLALAARTARERAAPSASEVGPLLTPEDFRVGLERTSEARLRELQEEHPWLEPLRRAFEGGAVPMDREEALSRLQSVPWPEQGDERAPPTTDAARLLDEYLVRLGIFESRPDSRLNTPDLYRHALKLSRKGGVARRPT